MKVFVRNKVYLQAYEVSYIMRRNISFPSVMYDELADKYSDESDDLAESLSFAYVFREPYSIEWIMAKDWIVDFDEFAFMPADDVKIIHDQLVDERRKKINEFNERSDFYRLKHVGKARMQFDLLSHKIRSLEDMYKFRKSELAFDLPSGYLKWGSNGKTAYCTKHVKNVRWFFSKSE